MATTITPVSVYTEQEWINGDSDKPLNAKRLTHIEDGISTISSSQLGGTTIAFTDGNFYITDADGTKTKKLGSSEGTAVAADVLRGKTFNSADTPDSEDYSTGAMENYSENVQTITCSNSSGTVTYSGDSFPSGYHTSVKVNQAAPYNKGYSDASPSAATVTAAGAITVAKVDNTTASYTTTNSYNNGYSAGKTDYNPTQYTLSKAGALVVKNSSGTSRYSATVSNSYNSGVSAGISNTANILAADAGLCIKSFSYKWTWTSGYWYVLLFFCSGTGQGDSAATTIKRTAASGFNVATEQSGKNLGNFGIFSKVNAFWYARIQATSSSGSITLYVNDTNNTDTNFDGEFFVIGGK